MGVSLAGGGVSSNEMKPGKFWTEAVAVVEKDSTGCCLCGEGERETQEREREGGRERGRNRERERRERTERKNILDVRVHYSLFDFT